MSVLCRLGFHRWHHSSHYTIGRDRHGWPAALGARWCTRCGTDRQTRTEVRR